MLLRSVFLVALCAQLLLPAVSLAETLTFDDVLSKAIAHSYDLKISRYDVAAKREAVKERIYDYVPTVELRSYAEQYKDLTQGQATVNSVGDVVYSSGSQVQVTYQASAQVTLWDFGVRAKRMEIAEEDVLAGLAQGDRALLELKLAVLEEYAAAYTAAMEIRKRSEMLPLLEEIRDIRARTHEAGLSDAVGVIEADVQVDQAKSAIEQQRMELDQRLANLSYFTGEAYSGTTVDLAPLAEPMAPLPEFDPTRHPRVLYFDHEIAKKEAEISIAKRAMLPTLSGYSRYSWYGNDKASFDRAREDVRERGYSVGLYASLPLSEDFRSLHTLKRTELEASRLRAEREKTVAELRKSFRSIELKHDFLLHDVESRKALLEKVEKEQEHLSRLLEEASVNREVYLDKGAALMSQSIRVHSGITKSLVAINSMRIMSNE